MQQVFIKATQNAGFGGPTLYQPPLAGSGVWTFFDDVDTARHPVSVDCTIRNLALHVPGNVDGCTVTLMKNGVATSLATTLGAAVDDGVNTTDFVSLTAGVDDIAIRWTGTRNTTGSAVNYSLHLETPAFMSTYGLGAIAPVHAGAQAMGGTLGNGAFAGYSPGNDTATYSIVCASGSITRMDLLCPAGAPGMGSTWRARLVLNQVVQDGTGGTVDTTTTVTGTATTGMSVFDLPVTPGDHLETLVEILAVDVAFARLGLSVAFQADTDGEFMLCGGNNNAQGDFWWMQAAQSLTVETTTLSPAGPLPFRMLGLYTERGPAPGVGSAWTDNFRTDQTNTGLAPVMADLNRTAFQLHAVDVAASSLVSIEAVPTGSPAVSAIEFHWGLVGTFVAGPIVSTSYPIRRLRRFALPFDQNKWIRLSRVELIMQAGNGLSGTAATVQGYNPIVMFRLSRDGGATWDDELQMSTGKIGEYTARAFLNMLGRARNPVVELTSSDPVFVSWIDFTVDYDEGTS